MKTLTAANTHTVWSASIPPALWLDSGDYLRVETSFGPAVRYRTSATEADVSAVTSQSRGLSLTGPIFVAGAEPGDTLAVEICELAIAPWGYTSIVPGFGLLADDFSKPMVHLWDLSGGQTTLFREGVEITLDPFLGAIGVAPPEGETLPSIPPSQWGGNLDIRHARPGSTLYLPVAVPGAFLSLGDAHGAQGDGEVCGSAIETSAWAVIRVTVHKNWRLSHPALQTGPVPAPSKGPCFITTGIGPNLYGAAQESVRGMIDYLSQTRHLKPAEAYMLCSVCADLSISEVVDRPNWVVSCSFPLGIFR